MKVAAIMDRPNDYWRNNYVPVYENADGAVENIATISFKCENTNVLLILGFLVKNSIYFPVTGYFAPVNGSKGPSFILRA